MSNLTSVQRILLAAAWADGRLDESEATLLRRALQTAPLAAEELEKALQSAPSTNLDELLQEVSAEQREATMRSVLEMCFVDDILEVEEFELIEFLAAKMGLSDDTMERLRREAGGA